uniref:Uncharacterized protein n=1 Tax=Oryza brachyantha TaxID=4533 RepID=J3LTP5_ORYBR
FINMLSHHQKYQHSNLFIVYETPIKIGLIHNSNSYNSNLQNIYYCPICHTS